jgi:hypothetical protein
MLSFVLEDVLSLLLSESATRSRPIPLNTFTLTSILGLAQTDPAAASIKSKQAVNFICRFLRVANSILTWPILYAQVRIVTAYCRKLLPPKEQQETIATAHEIWPSKRPAAIFIAGSTWQARYANRP